MKGKLIITSTNPNLSQEEIEEELYKAVESRKLKQEKKEFRDVYLKNHKDKTAHAVHLVFQSMLGEIERVLLNNK